MTNGNGAVDLQGPLAGMWRDVYRKAGAVAEARTQELLKYHVYTYPHGAGDGGGGGGAVVAACMASDSGATLTPLPSGALTPIPFDTDDHDPEGYHDTAVNRSRFTVPAGLAGWHRFSASLRTEQTSSTDPPKEYAVSLRFNGAEYRATQSGVLGAAYGLDVVYAWTPYYHLAAGDYVQLIFTHNTGATAYLSTSLYTEARFSIERLVEATGGGGGEGGASVTITTDASLTSVEAPENTFALAARLSADAGNALSLHGDGLYATDTGGGGGTGNTTMYTQTGTPTGATNSLWFNPSESA